MNIKDLMYWRLAIWKFLNGTLKVGIAAFIGGTAAQTWDTMNPSEKTLVILSAILAMQTFIDGFLDQTLAQLKGDKPQELKTEEPPKTP